MHAYLLLYKIIIITNHKGITSVTLLYSSTLPCILVPHEKKKGMSEKCIKTLILLMANHKLIFHALGFYGLTMEIFSSYFSEITENSKKWKPLLVKEEKLSIIRVNSSYLRSMNDYRVTFLYRTFKFH